MSMCCTPTIVAVGAGVGTTAVVGTAKLTAGVSVGSRAVGSVADSAVGSAVGGRAVMPPCASIISIRASRVSLGVVVGPEPGVLGSELLDQAPLHLGGRADGRQDPDDRA